MSSVILTQFSISAKQLSQNITDGWPLVKKATNSKSIPNKSN